MTSKDLYELLDAPHVEVQEFSFSSITSDSRNVTSGTLFVALKGEHVDGHEFIEQAASAGAVAVIGDCTGVSELHGLPYVSVQHPRRALGLIAHRLQGNPSRELTVIGVTGTNGKSSTVLLIRRILEACGHRIGQFGTISYCIAGEELPAPHTTPFAEDLVSLFRKAIDAGCSFVVMEVSSHALEQERTAGIEFDAAVFTNLTQDHLDYHSSMEEYLEEKLKLFHGIEGEGKITIVNKEDPYAKRFVDASRVPSYTFGRDGDCRAVDIQIQRHATTFHIESPWGEADVSTKLLGAHNVSNALAAIATCGALGMPMIKIAEGVSALENIPGRFEHIDMGQEFQVIVDYAHTEDGLRNVLVAARAICSGKIIVVFGCGGDRDKGKRPKMAAVAAELADFSIVTSDNPRTESPERILLDIEVGMQHAGLKRDENYLVLLDRSEAIRTALDMAQNEDLVMIAGKGHEDYQIINTERLHFDDREVARALLEAR